MNKRFKIELARGADHSLLYLDDVLNNCPEGYRVHSIVPIASGGGYTDFLYVIFEYDE